MFVIVDITGDVNVLFVNVSVVSRPTNVSVEVGNVNVPVLEILEIIGEVNVLFVKVSVVARPIKVSVEVGNVNVPVLEILEITGDVNVLFAKVSEPLKVATVPVVGKVIDVFAVVVKSRV